MIDKEQVDARKREDAVGPLGIIQDMAMFVVVARARSFTEAGKTLSVAPSTLSRRLDAIELAMGVRLLQRSTRRFELTDAGADFFARSEALTLDVRRLHDDLRSADQQLTGRLVVTAQAEYALACVTQPVSDFARRHPQLVLELNLAPAHEADEPQRHDVALTLEPMANAPVPGSPVRTVGSLQRRLYASRRYLASAAPIETPADLAGHPCILEGRDPDDRLWRLRHDGSQHSVEVDGPLASNNASVRARLSSEHFGVAVLPDHMGALLVDDAVLQPVLAGWALPSMLLTATINESSSPGLAHAFVEWLQSNLSESPEG